MRWRFRSLLLAALIALVPGGLAGLIWPPLGTMVFVLVGAALWVWLDRRMPDSDLY